MTPKLFLIAGFLLAPLAALADPIAVRVVDEAGAPVEGTTVQVQRFDNVLPRLASATTNAQGIANYDLGAARFNANFFGRALAWKAGRALNGGSLVKLPDGVLTLTLKASHAVSGTIADGNGPVEGALVQLDYAMIGKSYFSLGTNSPLALGMAVRSDAQGRFTFEGVPAEAQLQLRVSGASYATQNIGATSGGEVKVQLRPGATLRGRVVGTDGAPLAGLNVMAAHQNDRNGQDMEEAETDAQGNYSFGGLESGTYNLLFGGAPDAAFIINAREGAVAVAGETRDLEVARAIEGVVVRGRVINAESKAGVANVSVGVFGATQPRSSSPTQVFATDKEGNFSARVAPGANSFYVLNSGQEWEQSADKVELDARAGTAPITLELRRAIPLRGRIVDKAGQGVQTKLAIKQEYDEYPLQSDGNGEFSIYPNMKGAVTIGRSAFNFPGQDDEAEAGEAPWEIVREQQIDLPAPEPIRIVVQRAKVGALSGRVEDENGAPIEGAKLKLMLYSGEGMARAGEFKEIVSDAQGRFKLPNVRTDQSVTFTSIEKVGYDLQGGGEIVRDGNDWKLQTAKMEARRSQLAGRVTLADGAPAAGALVFAAGSETRADPNGAYLLKVLPQGNVDVFADGARQFGFRNAQTALAGEAEAAPLDLKLAPQQLQPTDRDLAGEMINRARVLATATNYDGIGRLKLSDDGDLASAIESLIAAPTPSDQMSFALYRGAGNPSVPTPLLLRALGSIKDAPWRLYGATVLFAKRPDWPDDGATDALVDSLIRDADKIAADKNQSNKWASGIGLMGMAPLIERAQGEAAGRAALERAIAYTKAQYPEPGDGRLGGYLSMLAVNAESIALTSPALFAQLLDAITPTSTAYSRSLQEGTIAVAKTRGLEAATPFLRRMEKMPLENEDGPGGATNYALRQTTRKAIAAGGASAPALALQLARGLGADNNDFESEEALALAEAAFFQPPAVAAVLWKEALPQMSAPRGAQIAARAGVAQPALGAELLKMAREKLEAADEVNGWGNSVAAEFAFYEAKLDAASARARLEKAWWRAQGKTDTFRLKPDLVRAMATIDGERAFEWASLLSETDDENDERIRTLRDAAQWIEASERARARVEFERWSRDSTVFID